MSAFIEATSPHTMNTYGRLPIAISHGQGCRVWDVNGKVYLDALGGIAVNTLGHNHPELVPALQDQLSKIIHSCNYYHVPNQEKLAAKLVELSGMTNVFFCCTGLEANEAAIKLARKFGHDKGIDNPADALIPIPNPVAAPILGDKRRRGEARCCILGERWRRYWVELTGKEQNRDVASDRFSGSGRCRPLTPHRAPVCEWCRDEGSLIRRKTLRKFRDERQAIVTGHCEIGPFIICPISRGEGRCRGASKPPQGLFVVLLNPCQHSRQISHLLLAI